MDAWNSSCRNTLPAVAQSRDTAGSGVGLRYVTSDAVSFLERLWPLASWKARQWPKVDAGELEKECPKKALSRKP